MLLSITLVATGCSKGGDDNAQADNSNGGLVNTGGGGGGGTQNATQLLCDKDYKLTAGTVSPAYNGETNYLQLMEPCELDNIFRFNQNGTLTVDEGANVCAGSPQTSTGSWAFGQNNSTLTITDNEGSSEFSVVTLNGTTLKLGSQVQAQDGQTYNITLTFTKQ